MESVDLALALLSAAADPTRLRILLALDLRPLCVCELVSLVDVGQPAVSRHLGILQDAGLVDSHRDGWWVEYRLVEPQESELARRVLEGLRAETSDDPDVAAFLERAAAADRNELRGTAPVRPCSTRRKTGARS